MALILPKAEAVLAVFLSGVLFAAGPAIPHPALAANSNMPEQGFEPDGLAAAHAPTDRLPKTSRENNPATGAVGFLIDTALFGLVLAIAPAALVFELGAALATSTQLSVGS